MLFLLQLCNLQKHNMVSEHAMMLLLKHVITMQIKINLFFKDIQLL